MQIEARPLSLSYSLKEKTRRLHRLAERSGVIADVLGGRVSRARYALYLRNLLPAYQQLELGLEAHRQSPLIRELAQPEVYRSQALIADLGRIWGDDWAGLQLLPVARTYADRIAAAAEGAGEGLLGHAYVRYLGDLNGGQVMARLLARSPGLPTESLSFYDFPRIGDIVAYREVYRDALDRAARWLPDWSGVIASAVTAFEINIQLSDAVRGAAPADS